MSAITPFQFDGAEVRVIAGVEGAPLFVLADVCKVLGLTNPSAVAARLDEGDKGLSSIETPGGTQRLVTITESGVIDVTLDSRKPDARRFRRWLTHDVVPQIMQTGSYSRPDVAQITRSDLARMVLEAEEQLAIAAPKAEAFDAFLATTGDYSVNEAAKVLSRHHDILTGERRLRSWMEANGWIYREAGKPRAYQRRLDQGALDEKAQWHYHPETGEKVLDTPQVRVTAKGIEALAKALLKVADQGELDVEDGVA